MGGLSADGHMVFPTRPLRGGTGAGGTAAAALGMGKKLLEDGIVQAFGVCDHAVPDGKGKLRAQVELHLVAQSPMQRFTTVNIRCRVAEPGSMEVQEAEPGALRDDRHASVVTRHFHILLNDIFTQAIVAEVDCVLGDVAGTTAGRSSEVQHRCEIPLPIDITAFLTPMPASRLHSTAWDQAKCPARWRVPDETKAALAARSEMEIQEAVSCGGTLGRRGQDGDPVFMAELLAGRTLLVIIALAMSGGTVSEVVVRSEEERLATAILDIAKHHLLALATGLKSDADAVGPVAL